MRKLVPAIRAAHPGDALVEDAAIEGAVDCRLDAATQIAVGGKEALLIDTEKVLEVMGEGPVEDRALGMAPAIDLSTRSRCDRLHSEERRRNRRPRACARATPTRLA